MKKFLDKNSLLHNDTAVALYHGYAAPLPLIDYHCHLSPKLLAEDINFKNLTEVWISDDHYKWRAMRANGVDESFITGKKDDYAKFEKWAATVPFTLRNPLYHWTHLELQRYFNVKDLLKPETARKIYDDCTQLLQTKEFSVRNLLRKMNVEIVCTTDDPADTLEYHQQIKADGFEIKILPAFRPDKAMNVDDIAAFNEYVNKLEQACNRSINTYQNYLDALKTRHDFFATMGCTVSDHGLEYMYAENFTDEEVAAAFNKIRNGRELSAIEKIKFQSGMLYMFAVWDHEKKWVQQYHLGALRNNNSRMMEVYGPDAGVDSIGDFPQALSLSKFFDKLDATNQLAKTIIYNLNPSANEVFATMAGNFNDGLTAGKMQFGAAWWFLDQKDGITKQINALSHLGLLSRFAGMITDSRSFLSYPRHEYFRRILCNIFGEEIESGELPDDMEWTGKIIRDICYYNARNYFGW
jgi:glucuronate isomerase